MKELKVLQQQQILGKPLTLYGDFENPLFLAKEVAEWIEHSNPRMMLQAVDEDEKGVNIAYTLGGNQEAWFLTCLSCDFCRYTPLGGSGGCQPEVALIYSP